MRNSKDKCTKKVCELLVEKKITILFITAIVLSICFLCVPLLLKCQCIYENVQKILASLGNYKSSYFEACGAMIGTFLAVTSAIWIQQKSEEKQKADIIKKNATIIYWDIKMFYRENDILASRIQDELKQLQENKQTEEDVIKKFMFLREYSGVYIDANWISTVAELVGVLEQNIIDDIYWFYGEVSNLKNKLEQTNTYNLTNIKTIGRHLNNLGEKRSYYKENEKMSNVLIVLEKLIKR